MKSESHRSKQCKRVGLAKTDDPRRRGDFDPATDRVIKHIMHRDDYVETLFLVDQVMPRVSATRWDRIGGVAPNSYLAKVIRFRANVAAMMTDVLKRGLPNEFHFLTIRLQPGETTAGVVRSMRDVVARRYPGIDVPYVGVEIAGHSSLGDHAHILMGGFETGSPVWVCFNDFIDRRKKKPGKKRSCTLQTVFWLPGVVLYMEGAENLTNAEGKGCVIAADALKKPALAVLKSGTAEFARCVDHLREEPPRAHKGRDCTDNHDPGPSTLVSGGGQGEECHDHEEILDRRHSDSHRAFTPGAAGWGPAQRFCFS